MKTLNKFIIERLKLNKDSKAKDDRKIILIPFNADYAELKHKYQHNLITMEHNTNIFIFDYDEGLKIANKFMSSSSSAYNVPKDMSLEEFIEKWNDAEIDTDEFDEENKIEL